MCHLLSCGIGMGCCHVANILLESKQLQMFPFLFFHCQVDIDHPEGAYSGIDVDRFVHDPH